MRLIFYTHALVAGGAERVWADLASGFARSGAQVAFAVDRAASENLARLDRSIDLVVLGGGHARSVSRLSRLAADQRPAALLSALAVSNLKAVCAAGPAGVLARTVLSYHGFAESEPQRLSRLAWRLTPVLTRLAGASVAVSEGLRDDLVRRWRAPARRTSCIHNPVHGSPGSAPDAAALAARPHVVLSVGRLDANKNVADAIRALAGAPQADAELRILGDGPERPVLEGLARQLGLADRVRFLGYQEDPSASYSGAKCLILTSRTEAFGLVVVEALAHGLAVVSTDCLGPREILEGGRHGALAPVGDASALAHALGEALADPGDPQPRIERARDFSLDAALQRYAKLIESLPRSAG